MKPRLFLSLLLLLLAAALPAGAQGVKVFQFAVANSSTTTPAQLTNAPLLATSFTIIGKASAQGAANAGSVYIGTSSVDGANHYEIASGTYHVFTAEKGQAFRLSDFYFDVTSANDGVCILWQ